MISANELTQYPELAQCVQSGKTISDPNLPDMKGFWPVVNRGNWQIEGFVYADDPQTIAQYEFAAFDFNEGAIYSESEENGQFLVEAK